MPEPTGAQNDCMAAQPFLRSDGSSIRRMGSIAFGARAAFVLVGVLAIVGVLVLAAGALIVLLREGR